MKRKVIRMADCTSLISLPKNWINTNNINKGDEIEILEANNNLLIKGSDNLKSKTIDLTSITEKDLIWRYVVTSYRKGISNLIVLYDRKETLDVIQEFIGDLIGFAIVRHDDKTIFIKDLIQAKNSNLDDTFKQIISLLLVMGNNIYAGISKADKNVLDSIDHDDYNINRFTNMFLRILNREGHLNFESTNSYYKIISLIEEIGDEFRRLSQIYDGKKVNNSILALFKSVNYLLKDYEELASNFDYDKFKNFHDVSNRIMKLKLSISPKTLNETNVLGSLATIYHLTKSLWEESAVINN